MLYRQRGETSDKGKGLKGGGDDYYHRFLK